MWLSAEEEGFGRTLAQGMSTLSEHIAAGREQGATTIPAEEVFRLHDTYGFPYEMTTELLAAEGLSIEGDFEELMERQRERGRAQSRNGAGEGAVTARAQAGTFAGASGFETRFTGYETGEQRATVGAVESLSENGSPDGRRYLVKLDESPFYAPGGGQVGDVGTIECAEGDCRARIEEVFRLGDDQALEVLLEEGTLQEGEQVIARVDRRARHATEANHTATHLLQAALRERLGGHIRQAGSYVGPDKLRFDFSHGQGLSEQELRDVEDRVNDWISRNDPVRAITTTLPEARALGAMALFGEKYGEVVRMVEVGQGDYSRELCGGTHVRSTAEIGPFRITGETSSSANVRRIEAVTGPAAVELLRRHDSLLGEIATRLRTRPEDAPAAVGKLAEERRQLLRDGAAGSGESGDLEALLGDVIDIEGASVLVAQAKVADAKALLALADRLKGQLPDAAILLGASAEGRVHLLASVAPSLVERGLRAGELVKVAAAPVGGGGGGRDTMAQAGGRDPERLGEAMAAGLAAIREALAP
jgi:alanyl-tRNA synthetase